MTVVIINVYHFDNISASTKNLHLKNIVEKSKKATIKLNNIAHGCTKPLRLHINLILLVSISVCEFCILKLCPLFELIFSN